jgi:hypothetical protein
MESSLLLSVKDIRSVSICDKLVRINEKTNTLFNH